jgi:ribosomal protein S18 acetylase RimI-like enzyme
MEYYIKPIEINIFAKYYAVYSNTNIFACFDWNEKLRDTSGKAGYFIMSGNKFIGGFTQVGSEISYPFLITPFNDRISFWEYVLDYTMSKTEKSISLKFINETDELILIEKFGAKTTDTQKRMIRPTEALEVKPINGFYFSTPSENDKQEIIKTIFEAHSSGYTANYRETDINQITEAITRRFSLFGQTNTLHMSTLVRDKENNTLAGVCIAGIYPDSPNNFSTIHQVSVRPQFRRRGIAEAMMLNSINIASSISPVITLGVMTGNPAELLYNKIGFIAAPKYSDLYYTV